MCIAIYYLDTESFCFQVWHSEEKHYCMCLPVACCNTSLKPLLGFTVTTSLTKLEIISLKQRSLFVIALNERVTSLMGGLRNSLLSSCEIFLTGSLYSFLPLHSMSLYSICHSALTCQKHERYVRIKKISRKRINLFLKESF